MADGIEMATSTRPQIIKGSKVAPPPLSTFCKPASEPIAIKKAVLIFNPVSGGKKGKLLAENVVAPMFKSAGVELVLSPTAHAGHAIELAASMDLSGVDALCALGGDGTLSDVASGFLARADGKTQEVALGFIPGGTGNTIMNVASLERDPPSLACACSTVRSVLSCSRGACVRIAQRRRHDVLGYRAKMGGRAAIKAAVAAILGGRTRLVDCSQLECAKGDGSTVRRHSLNIVTCGLGVDASAAAEKRRWMGPMRYDVSILMELLKLGSRKDARCRLTVDGVTKELDLFVLTMMNNKCARHDSALPLSCAPMISPSRLRRPKLC